MKNTGVKLSSLSNRKNRDKYDELTKNSVEFNNNSTKNIEIKKETLEVRPKSKVRKENYIHIPGWAVCELGLKGNELLIYAIIFGFSQEENQTFKGSQRYLADWTNSTTRSVRENLKSLVKKGFIGKIERFENGVKFCEYYATRLRTTQKEDAHRISPGGKKVPGGGENFSPNILENNLGTNSINRISNKYIRAKNCASMPIEPDTESKNNKCANARTGNDAHSVLETQYLQQKNQCIPIDTLDFSYTNALSDKYKNALSTNNNKNICAKDCASVIIEPDTESKNDKYANAQPLIENKNTEPLSASKNKSLRKAKPKLAPKVLEEEFNTVWDLYPKKKDKTRAFKAFSKARIEGVPLEKIREGVQKYVQEIKNTGIAHQYIKYGSTWFNNRCWEDEYDTNTKSSYDLDEYVKAMGTFSSEPKKPPERLGLWL